jgi:hypothetical protein
VTSDAAFIRFVKAIVADDTATCLGLLSAAPDLVSACLSKGGTRGGADARRKNNNGSTPMQIATRNTGRGGSGSVEAKAEQIEIIRLLQQHGAG